MPTILVVDDSATDRKAIVAMVQRPGVAILEAENADQAMALASAKKPDLILMDVVMPGSSGYEATRNISKDPELSKIPVIIVSNRAKETDKLWGMRQGAKAYIGKPVDAEELNREIARVLVG